MLNLLGMLGGHAQLVAHSDVQGQVVLRERHRCHEHLTSEVRGVVVAGALQEGDAMGPSASTKKGGASRRRRAPAIGARDKFSGQPRDRA